MIALAICAVIIVAVYFYDNPEISAETTLFEPVVDERPFDENNYPAHQVIRTLQSVDINSYFRFIDSITEIRPELRGLDMPGDRIVALSNTWIIDSLASSAIPGHQGLVIPAGSRINIPDTATAKWINLTLRKNQLIIDLRRSMCFINSGSDTILKASVLPAKNGFNPQGLEVDSIRAIVTVLHRATRYGHAEQKSLKLPCLEIHTTKGPIFLMGSAPDGWKHEAGNFFHLSPADIWMVYHLAPPGTPVLIISDPEGIAIRTGIRR